MDEKIEENVLRQTEYFRGLHTGVEQERERKSKEIVLEMCKDNQPIEIIAKYTKLSVSEIENIISENK